MTKMNWDRAKRIPPQRRRQRAAAFKARHPGWCRNCGTQFGVGAALRYNINDEVVHANVCPPRWSTR